jgi:hypothetical protein
MASGTFRRGFFTTPATLVTTENPRYALNRRPVELRTTPR